MALCVVLPVFSNSLITPIDAQKNAQMHNSMGATFMKEKDYLAAIKEFKIAIAINPYHQSTAVYYNNLGCSYLELSRIQVKHKLTKKDGEFAVWAQISFENAIMQDCMNLSYYKNLVESFSLQGNLSSKLAKYKKSSEKNQFDKIILGLIYEKMGKKAIAKGIFDEFTSQNPDLIISKSLKKYY